MEKGGGFRGLTSSSFPKWEMISIKLQFIKLSTLAILLFLLMACTNNDLEDEDVSFKGESQNWRVVMDVEKLATPGSNIRYSIYYIGEDPKPDNLSYEIEPENPFSTPMESTLKDQDEVTILIGGDTEPVHKNMPFVIRIEWEGKSEDVLIKIKKSYQQVM